MLRGEWVYGTYCRYGREGLVKSYIIPENAVVLFNYEVQQETVGQYIGFRDVKGRRIFEGDILRLTAEKEYSHYWVIHDIRTINPMLRHIHKYEIIGNVYDNPELIKER